MTTTAPEFELASVDGAPVALAQLRGSGHALLIFASEECPTCLLTLRRLEPLVESLEAAGVNVTAVFEDPVEVAARAARGARFTGTVLSEPPPYDISRAYEVQSLPTSVLVDPAGTVMGRVVGWDAGGIEALLELAGAPVSGVT